MKMARHHFLIPLFIVALFFLVMPQFRGEYVLKKSQPEGCGPIYQMDKEGLSRYLEVFRAYSLPPAWSSNEGRDELSINQGNPDWEARSTPGKRIGLRESPTQRKSEHSERRPIEV